MEKHISFDTFYPFYLNEHSNSTCRKLHFVGTSLSLLCIIQIFRTGNVSWLLLGLVMGYGFAWVGHFVFEKNKPASFKQPIYSFMGDWTMWWQLLIGKIPFNPSKSNS